MSFYLPAKVLLAVLWRFPVVLGLVVVMFALRMMRAAPFNYKGCRAFAVAVTLRGATSAWSQVQTLTKLVGTASSVPETARLHLEARFLWFLEAAACQVD